MKKGRDRVICSRVISTVGDWPNKEGSRLFVEKFTHDQPETKSLKLLRDERIGLARFPQISSDGCTDPETVYRWIKEMDADLGLSYAKAIMPLNGWAKYVLFFLGTFWRGSDGQLWLPCLKSEGNYPESGKKVWILSGYYLKDIQPNWRIVRFVRPAKYISRGKIRRQLGVTNQLSEIDQEEKEGDWSRVKNAHPLVWGDASEIEGDVSGLVGDVSKISGDVSRITGLLLCFSHPGETIHRRCGRDSQNTMEILMPAGVEGNVSNISGDISGLIGDVSHLSGDVSGIFGELEGRNVKGNVSGIKGNITGITGDFTGIEGEVTEILRILLGQKK
ncbi:MAG: hypothetical protein HQ530_04435 [Parcubacteria group bacterium]|nr:hypothetical protein [Parcubacteria group bacterium]